MQGFRILNSYHTPIHFLRTPKIYQMYMYNLNACFPKIPCWCAVNLCPFIFGHLIFTSLVLFKMLSSKAPLLFCQNPFCLKFNKKPFSNQAAYTQHIDRNIGCYNFIVKKSHLAATHGASVSHRCRLHEDGNVTCTSNKRPALLRQHLVNDPHMDFVGKENLLQSL